MPRNTEFPKNKFLQPEAEAILNNVLQPDRFRELAGDFNKLREERSEYAMSQFVEKVLSFADSLSLSIFGKRFDFPRKRAKVMIISSLKVALVSPEVATLLDANKLSVLFQKTKKYSSRLSRRLSRRRLSKKAIKLMESKQTALWVLTNIRKEWYEGITGPNPKVKEKVDSLYALTKEVFSSPSNIERMDVLYGSELYTRILSIAQGHQKILRAYSLLERKRKQINSTYVQELSRSYAELYDSSEILVKILFSYVLINDGKEPDLRTIQHQSASSCIDLVNKRLPGIFEGRALIRNAYAHPHNTTFNNIERTIALNDKSESAVLTFDEYVEETRRMADTFTGLLSITSLQLIYLLDLIIIRLKNEMAST